MKQDIVESLVLVMGYQLNLPGFFMACMIWSTALASFDPGLMPNNNAECMWWEKSIVLVHAPKTQNENLPATSHGT